MAKKFSDLAGACWKGYKAVGLKDKNGKKVPNCVPEEVQLEAKKDDDDLEKPTVDREDRSDYRLTPSGRKAHKQIVFKMGEEDLKEGTVSKKDYSWGKMMTVHHGKDISYPLHPEHQKIVKNLRPSGEHSKAMYKDETGNQVHVTRENDKVHFVSHRTSGSKKTTVDYKHFDESVPAKNTDVSDKSWLKDAGKKPTVKSDLKNFKNFLTGKKETNEEVEISEAAPFKNKDDAVKYAKDKVKTHRDNLDGIEIYAHSGGFDVNHTSNSSGRNSLNKIGAKHLGTIYKEEVESVEEGWYQKPASAYRRKGDEVGGGSSKNDVPFDGPYTKTKPAKNSDGTTQSPMSRARALAKDAMTQKMKEEFGLDITDEQADSLVEASYAPVAPVPDKKYIKGTPEHKAYKATKKPINGMPTNIKEGRIVVKTNAANMDDNAKHIEKLKAAGIDANQGAGSNGHIIIQDRDHDKAKKILAAHLIEDLDEKLNVGGGAPVKSANGVVSNTPAKSQSSPKPAAPVKKPMSSLEKLRARMDSSRKPVKEEMEIDEALRPGFTHRDAAEAQRRREQTLANNPKIAAEVERRKAAADIDKKKMKEELDEANHREFASQGKMHPDMAKHMSVGQEMDYYEHGTGDKVSGKVLKNDGKEVHIKQTHDSYDPKKKGTIHKFAVSSKLDEKAPPGFEGTVKAMKKHKEIDNPYALAWYMKNKGMKSHKEEFDDNGELITNMKSYKEFLESLDEVKMSDLPSRKVSGKYGTEYYKGEAEKDVKGYDDEDTPAKPAGEKRGRGRPAGSTSGARQKGTIAKRKGSGVEMTGYPVHLPNFK